MKSSDLREAGYYWYRDDNGAWEVILAAPWTSDYLGFTHMGREVWFKAEEMPGEFIGPIEPPHVGG